MKKYILLLVVLLFWGTQAMGQTSYKKTIEVNQDTIISILDFVSNQSGNGEEYVFNRVVNFNNGKNKIMVKIPETIKDLRFIKNCKQVSSRSFVFEKAGNFTFSYVKSGETFRVLGDLNYTCELLLDGKIAPDSILINSDEDLERELGVPDGKFIGCWWYIKIPRDSSCSELPQFEGKMSLSLGDLLERSSQKTFSIKVEVDDGSFNSNEEGYPLGASSDSLVIIDKRLLNGISSNALEEFSVTPTTCGFIIQGAKSGQKLCLYSLSGQLVWSDSVKGSSQEVMLPGISGGTYILRVENVSLKVIF